MNTSRVGWWLAEPPSLRQNGRTIRGGMPVPVHAEFDEGIIVMRMVGSYSTADVRDALVGVTSACGDEPVAGMLLDVRPSEVLHTRGTAEVREMARFIGLQGRLFGQRLALIATADYAYGLMRLGSVITEQAGISTAVFRDEPEARAWLRPA